MASREEEKRKRREEREAQQRAKDQANKRGRLVVIGGAIAAAIVVIVVGVVLATGSGGDDTSTEAAAESGGAPIPEQQEKDFNTAVKASGCTFTEHPNEGATHQSEPFDDYKTNPPTSGTHNPEPAADGIYEPGNSPDPNNWVHTLEHGRVIIQYKPGTSEKRIAQLKTLAGENVNGSPGYHMVLLENNTDMPYEVAAVTWTRSLTCKEFTDETFDAIRVFRDRWVDKAPELVP
ncbi:MAG: DUF3105 domain-containing protein [Baekduiaceae bacterium]